MEPLAVNVEEAARMVALSPHTLRAYLRDNKIRGVHLGRRVVIPVSELQRLIAEGIGPTTLSKPEGRIQ